MSLDMSTVQLKNLFKEALIEVLHEQRDLLADALAEVMEDWAMSEAMRAETETERVPRDEIMQILADTP